MRLHELNEGLDANQKRVGQVGGEESAKPTGPVLGAKQKQHPFKGRLVGEESKQGVAEGSNGVSVRGWANQVRKDHGADVKFFNRKEGGGAVDSVIARNSQGETVGVYNRKTGYPTVFEPKQGVAEGNDEKIADRYDQDEWEEKMRRLKKLAGAGPLKTVWDPEKRVYKNVPVNQNPEEK